MTNTSEISSMFLPASQELYFWHCICF